MKIPKDHSVIIQLKWDLKYLGQYDFYLNSKVAPNTCNATGLWLSSEPESKIVPLLYSNGNYSASERMAHFYGHSL